MLKDHDAIDALLNAREREHTQKGNKMPEMPDTTGTGENFAEDNQPRERH